MFPQTASTLNQNTSLSVEEWVNEHRQANDIDTASFQSLNESDASGQCLLPENWNTSSECSTQLTNVTFDGAPDGYSRESTQTAFPSIPIFSHGQQQTMNHSSLQSPPYSDSRVLSQFTQFGATNVIPPVAEVDESLSWNPPPAAAVQEEESHYNPDLYYGIPASLPSGSSSPFNMQRVSHFTTPVWNQNTFYQVESQCV
ncbi:hypothetical protein MPER_10383 [Moniliophthora perniciosa FA553]|nr:hypothetical protein MPER_10383 [Moniliophthora perniciosa FA553]